MSCAGCDDCPQDAWHLHVTVTHPNTYTEQNGSFVASLGYRPVIVVNVINAGDSYAELIPTLHVKCTEMEAVRKLFRMGTQLEKAGFDVKRLKIEGDARIVPEGRALYYETHLKGYENLPAPLSINAKGEKIFTIRRQSIKDIEQVFGHWRDMFNFDAGESRIEACVLDTAPELDDEWLKSADRGIVTA